MRCVLVVVLSGLALVLAGCGSSTSSGGKSKAYHNHANALDWFNNVGEIWVATLDPATVSSAVDASDVSMVNANLVKQDIPSLKVIPDLATWTVSADHRTYTFHIRPNARFSNGDPVTAQDAAWSLTRTLDPATRSPIATTYLGHIEGALDLNSGKTSTLSGVKALGTHTLQIKLDQPIAFFLPALSFPTGDVLDRRVMEGQTPQSYLTNNCSGNAGAGPFRFVCQNGGSGQGSFYPTGQSPYMQFEPNPYYYGPKPTINVYSPFFASADSAYQDFETGALDGISVPSQFINDARGRAGFISHPVLQTDYIIPNMQTTPFNNVHCRLAVAYAINRAGITEKILNGAEGPLYDVIPPGLLSYFGQQPSLPHYDPVRAKAELAQCPGKLQNVTLTYSASSTSVTYEYLAILSNLSSIGADIRLNQVTSNKWLSYIQQPLVNSGQQIVQNGWIADYPDPQDWLGNLLSATAAYNIGGFQNTRYNQLVNAANVEFDQTKRGQLYRQAQEIALVEGAWIGVGYVNGNFVVNPSIHGMVSSPLGIGPINADWSQVTVSG